MTKTEHRIIHQWEETLIADYYDYRSRKLLDPLYEQFQQWKAGSLSHDALFNAIHLVHKGNQEFYNFYSQKRQTLAKWIQFDPWFDEWLKTHPAPEGADLLPDSMKAFRTGDMEPTETKDDA